MLYKYNFFLKTRYDLTLKVTYVGSLLCYGKVASLSYFLTENFCPCFKSKLRFHCDGLRAIFMQEMVA